MENVIYTISDDEDENTTPDRNQASNTTTSVLGETELARLNSMNLEPITAYLPPLKIRNMERMKLSALAVYIGKFPTLWDKTLPLYSDLLHRDSLWENIGKCFNCSSYMVQKKWKHLKMIYEREYNKCANTGKKSRNPLYKDLAYLEKAIVYELQQSRQNKEENNGKTNVLSNDQSNLAGKTNNAGKIGVKDNAVPPSTTAAVISAKFDKSSAPFIRAKRTSDLLTSPEVHKTPKSPMLKRTLVDISGPGRQSGKSVKRSKILPFPPHGNVSNTKAAKKKKKISATTTSITPPTKAITSSKPNLKSYSRPSAKAPEILTNPIVSPTISSATASAITLPPNGITSPNLTVKLFGRPLAQIPEKRINSDVSPTTLLTPTLPINLSPLTHTVESQINSNVIPTTLSASTNTITQLTNNISPSNPVSQTNITALPHNIMKTISPGEMCKDKSVLIDKTERVIITPKSSKQSIGGEIDANRAFIMSLLPDVQSMSSSQFRKFKSKATVLASIILDS